ncbi:anti-sigma factor domain-containing protein [Nocardiopsis sediminis]|uniref:Regulator of SigK n=1 Tax=Nocardiopsis sediminis TaxID=1778267 RepID=A0ABV8FJ41_9ACTN
MTRPDHDDHGLTAGYAVDALADDERRRAQRHLEECADCRRDLDDFRATTVRLAYGAARAPGDHVWQRLRASVPQIRQLPPVAAAEEPDRSAPDGNTPDGSAPGGARAGGAVDAARRRRRFPLSPQARARLPWVLAAAALLIAVALGGTSVSMGMRMSEMRTHSAEVEALLAASDAQMRASQVGRSDARATVVASQRNDAVMIVVEGLPPAPSGRAYQMWYVDDDGMRSAGMLQESGDGMLAGMADGLGSAREIGITLEPESGMPEPTGDPMKVEV